MSLGRLMSRGCQKLSPRFNFYHEPDCRRPSVWYMAHAAAAELIAGLRGAARAAPLVFAFTQYGLTITPVEGRSMQPTLNDGVGTREAVCLDRLCAHSAAMSLCCIRPPSQRRWY